MRISSPSDRDTYSRYLDAVIAQGGIKREDIIGIGEASTTLYLITKQAVMTVGEYGVFKKRIESRQVAPVKSIVRYATKDLYPTAASIKFEGRSQAIFSLTGWDARDQAVLDIKWEASSISPEISSQREHLFKLLGEATGRSLQTTVGLKPLTPHGEALVKHIAEGNSSQFVEVTPDRIWIFLGEFEVILDSYHAILAALDPQWESHVATNLYRRV